MVNDRISDKRLVIRRRYWTDGDVDWYVVIVGCNLEDISNAARRKDPQPNSNQ